MRQTILASLLVSALTPAVLAQTIGDEEYTAYQDQLAADTWSLVSLQETLDVVLSEHDSISEASEYDRGMLHLVAGDALRTVDIMRIRSRTMFTKVEDNYELYCLKGAPGPLPCADYKETYRAMIVDTIIQGTIFYTITKESRDILSQLNK